MPDKPLCRMPTDNGKPEWQQIVDLFARHGLSEPPWRLRDELVTHLAWAKYGQAKADEVQA